MEYYEKLARQGELYWNGREWKYKCWSAPEVDENLAPKGDIIEALAHDDEVAKAFDLTIKEIAKYLGKRRIDVTHMSPDKLHMIADKLGKHN